MGLNTVEFQNFNSYCNLLAYFDLNPHFTCRCAHITANWSTNISSYFFDFKPHSCSNWPAHVDDYIEPNSCSSWSAHIDAYFYPDSVSNFTAHISAYTSPDRGSNCAANISPYIWPHR